MRLAALAAVAFVAAVIGAITGGNSLLTVPAMLLAGMEPHIAVGTNMISVVALTGSAWARFAREKVVPRHPTWGLTLTAIPGSIAGAFVAVHISQHRSEEHTSELQSRRDLVCRLLLEKKKKNNKQIKKR